MIRVFTATAEGNGAYEGDVFEAVEGELVTWPSTCDTPDSCGCRWQLIGLGSHKWTSTFTVADTGLTADEYRELLRDHFRQQPVIGEELANDPEILQMIGHWLEDAAEFEPGEILDWWDDAPHRREFCSCDEGES